MESTESKKARIMGSWMVAERSRFTAGDAAAHLSKPKCKISEDTGRTLLYALYQEGKLSRHVDENGGVKYSAGPQQILRQAWVKPFVHTLNCSPRWC